VSKEEKLVEYLHQYVEHIGGPAVWNDVLDEYGKASVETPKDMIRLLRICASLLSREYQFFLFTFGKWYVTIGDPMHFKSYLSPHKTFEEFMLSKDAPKVIKDNLPWHEEDSIQVRADGSGHFTIYYRSGLRLFSLVKGIYAGLAELMGITVLVRHRAKGAHLTLIDIIVG